MAEESSTRVCQNPDCDDDATETYTDAHGNELDLCEQCYFDAVYPPTPVRSIVKRNNEERPPGLLGRFTR